MPSFLSHSVVETRQIRMQLRMPIYLLKMVKRKEGTEKI